MSNTNIDYSELTRAIDDSDAYETQKDFAESLGVSTRTIQRWKKEESTPNKENRKKLRRRGQYYEVGRYSEEEEGNIMVYQSTPTAETDDLPPESQGRITLEIPNSQDILEQLFQSIIDQITGWRIVGKWKYKCDTDKDFRTVTGSSKFYKTIKLVSYTEMEYTENGVEEVEVMAPLSHKAYQVAEKRAFAQIPCSPKQLLPSDTLHIKLYFDDSTELWEYLSEKQGKHLELTEVIE